MTEDLGRWLVTIYYRSETGGVDVDHYIEELEDLHDIKEIVVVPSGRVAPMTIEQAERE